MFTPKIIKKIRKANLIGRGCNSFPTAKKWNIVRRAKAPQKFVICNVSESEPGVFKDKHILEKYPDRVIDGIILAGQTIKADQGFIYLNPDYYKKFATKLNKIIADRELNIEIYAKPAHDYIGGEETAVINSMSGKRVEPNLKPPFPTITGFNNQPTLVNNCETFYAVSLINSNEYHNTRFYCYSEFKNGKYINQKILKLPIDATVKNILSHFKHVPSDEFFYQVGGAASGNCYNSKQLNRKFTGLASIVVYKKNIPEQDLILHWANFFKNESCGQCVPCREGTYRLYEILEKKYLTNEFNQEIFDDLILSLQNSSLCPLGKVSANAILSYYKNIKKTNNEKLKMNNEKCEIK